MQFVVVYPEVVISSAFYKLDYNQHTKTFLAWYVSYEQTIESLKKIIDSDYLPAVIDI